MVIFFYANIEKGEKNVKIKRESREWGSMREREYSGRLLLILKKCILMTIYVRNSFYVHVVEGRYWNFSTFRTRCWAFLLWTKWTLFYTISATQSSSEWKREKENVEWLVGVAEIKWEKKQWSKMWSSTTTEMKSSFRLSFHRQLQQQHELNSSRHIQK